MNIVAVASQKGGVGKSTLCIHLAGEAVRKKQRAVILEIDRQGTSSALWNERRAELYRPDDIVRDIDPNSVQPEVHRVDSINLDRTIAELGRGGMEFVVLDLPGTHSAAVMKAISVCNYLLIPTRPNDVDLQASVETADTARRLKKRFAYIFTFVPSTGTDAVRMRDTLEDEGLVVAPVGLGDRRKEFAAAIENGQTAYELNPKSKSATEIRNLWKWLDKQLGVSHGRKVA